MDVGLRDGGKSAPVLVMSVPFAGEDRALITVVMHTTSLRGSEWEIAVAFSPLKMGAFLAQSVATYAQTRAVRRLGTLPAGEFAKVETAVFQWLGR